MVNNRFDLLHLILVDLPPRNWHELPIPDFIILVGNTVIVEIAPGHWRCTLLLFDPGLVRYFPPLSLPLCRLLLLLHLKAAIMHQLALDLRPGHDEVSMIAYRRAVEDVCERFGITTALYEQRAQALRVSQAYRSEQTFAAEQRAVSQEVERRTRAGVEEGADAVGGHGGDETEERGAAGEEDVAADVRAERRDRRADRMSATVQA